MGLYVGLDVSLKRTSVCVTDGAGKVVWRVEETKGAIGFAAQRDPLDAAADWLPSGAKVVPMADRFYGTPDLIGWCQNRQWGYRLRLKGNLPYLCGFVQPGGAMRPRLSHQYGMLSTDPIG